MLRHLSQTAKIVRIPHIPKSLNKMNFRGYAGPNKPRPRQNCPDLYTKSQNFVRTLLDLDTDLIAGFRGFYYCRTVAVLTRRV